MNNTQTHNTMELPATFRPFATWSTETLREEIRYAQEWVEAVPICRTPAQLRKHIELDRMLKELDRREA